MGTHYQGTAAEKQALNTCIKLSRAAETISQRVHGHLNAYDLTTSQFGVLEALYYLGPLQVGQVGEKILKSSGNMTLVVDNLVKRGLVERQRREDDRRCIELHLTEDGRSLIAALMPQYVAQVVTAMNALSQDQQAQLAVLCRQLGLAQEKEAASTIVEPAHSRRRR